MITVQRINKEVRKSFLRFIQWTEEVPHWRLSCDGDLDELHLFSTSLGLDKETDYFPFGEGYPHYIITWENWKMLEVALACGAEPISIEEQIYIWNNRFNTDERIK